MAPGEKNYDVIIRPCRDAAQDGLGGATSVMFRFFVLSVWRERICQQVRL